MVEFEDKNVGLAAVDAWMRREVVEEAESVIQAECANARDFARNVDLAVVQVVLASIRRMALAAVRLQLASRERAEREFGRGLVLMAHHADRHRRTSGRAPPQPVENAS